MLVAKRELRNTLPEGWATRYLPFMLTTKGRSTPAVRAAEQPETSPVRQAKTERRNQNEALYASLSNSWCEDQGKPIGICRSFFRTHIGRVKRFR